MSFENQLLIGTVTICFMVALYFADLERKKRSERQRQKMEHEQRINDLIDKKANQYLDWERDREDSGLSALTKINLYELDGHESVRECIEKIKLSCQTNPWQGQEKSVKDVDLCEFFKFVCKNRIWPSNIKVEQAVQEFQIDKEK